VAGCNIYKETVGTQADTADEHILDGQLLLQKAKYGDALAQFQAAIGKDSAKSEAYYGAAKCRLLQQRINMFQLMQSFQENDGKSIPFLSEPDSIKDKIFVANRGINEFLGLLADRDARKLSDGKIPLARFSADYALASAIEAVLSLADFNGDGRINAKDNVLNGIIDFSDPSKLNPDSIMANIADLKNDTAKIAALNNLLEKSEELLSKSGKAIDLFLAGALDKQDSLIGGKCEPADTNCLKAKAALPAGQEKVGDSAIGQVKKFIQDAGATVVIYKVFDKLDNDGDGCTDEELLDGIDNDGDGKSDEDSRGAPDTAGNVNYKADKDNADNDGDGKTDAKDDDEALFHTRYESSFAALSLILHPERKGQIYWGATDSGLIDTRRTVIVTDSSVTPPAKDTIWTFDLCKGAVKGFKKGK
jgi:hypothetical protein